MNVGSILNDEPSPSKKTDNDDSGDSVRPDMSTYQRHSLVNLLNDPAPNNELKSKETKKTGSEDEHPNFKVPVTESNQQLSPVLRRSSIADITNENDVDISSSTEHPIKQEKSEKEEDELARISKLKSTNKPRRYIEPPVWAQEWIPTLYQGTANGTPIVNVQESSLSSKPVFDRTLTVNVDLECSITGVIPPPSVTRTIAEWIYANFTEIPDDQRKYVELELKFGTIIDKRAGHRIDINVSTECIFTDNSNTYFDMGVHEVGWNDMCKFLDDLEKSYQDDLRRSSQANSNVPKRKFNMLESDITDNFYQITSRNEQPKSIRVSKDNLLDPPRYTAINKQRLSSLFIHNPSSMYDLRLSLSYENPIADNNIDGIIKKNQPTLTRIKKRNSWTHRPTVTRFDMTRVLLPRELKNKSGKKIVEQDQSFEVELEVDTLELFNGFDKFKSGADSIRFEELVEIFVNNARCLNNRVTKLANK
ncbi:unnamed protein product [Debaryomyces tyrocola]|nr:unnamed protein product [Debaryomyces tyrocola]